jgi:hypothetical protein
VNFEIGYEVLAHLRKECFPKGKYSKIKIRDDFKDGNLF